MSNDFIDIIKARGFVHQMTDEAGLRALLKSGPQTAYIGFDCTAASLHVGSLLQIMLLRWWQKTGNKPIVLLGGGTTKIGDPSGKDESRPPLTDEKIAANMAGIKTVFDKFIDFRNAEMVDNADWLDKLNTRDFLRDYGKLFSVNRMLTMDSVKLRLERQQHLSFLEFHYMIFQAYDFLELYRKYGCRVQMGGSDQWGNIVTGIDLVASVEKMNAYAITSPLITTSSGAKMGKTADGAVWLNADMVSPYDYWQFWRNTHDNDVERFLKLFTEVPLADISAAIAGNINDAKKLLATEATALLHGRPEAEKAAVTAAETFGGSGVSENLPEIFSQEGAAIYALLVEAGFAASNSEARRLMKGNGVSLNDVKVTDDNTKLTADNLAQGFAKLSAGKKRHVLVKVK